MMRVAIVGGGAAGVLAAAHLRRRKPDAQITLIDASGHPGTGAAYGTNDPTHLLNVPAQRMSAWPEDPDHFCRWLDERAVAPCESFAPRLAYGRYLRDQLAAADVRIQTAEVVGLTPGTPVGIALNDGRSLSADAVVLASGRPDGGMPDSLERAFAPVLATGTDDRVVLDPWAPGALAALGAQRPASVLVIGSGLTGVDVALHLIVRGATVTLLSRHGALPRRFRATGAPAEVSHLDALSTEVSLEQLRASLDADLAHAREIGSDWRQVIDAVRPRTARLWRSLGWEDQRRFLREDLRQWEVLRHRMPPTIADSIYAAIDSGQLIVEAGEVADVSLHGNGVELVVTTTDGSVRRRGDAVVVATGSMWDRRSLQNSTLWANLLANNVASPHPSGVGVRLDPDGYLIDGSGSTVPDIVCLGSIRMGEEWESTAIPEISAQAAAIAQLFADDARERPVPAPSLITTEPGLTGAAASYAEGVRRLLAVQDGASVAFAAAVAEDPHHARAHIALAMIATERPDRAGGPDAVTGHLARARAALAHGSDEDRSHVEAIATWCEKGNAAGTDALIDHLGRVPDDAVALLVLAPSIAFAGAGDALPDAWQYVEQFTGVHGEAPWYLGLRAYGRTEQGLWYDAADLADAALGLDPGNGNAAHALSHVHYETDAHGAGLKWLTDWIPGDGSTQRYLAHFQWHAALHELAMGDAAAAARRYAAFLAPPHSKDVRCLVDAGSLAWRARLHPDWVTPPDPMAVLAEVGSLAYAPKTPFIAFHALLVLAAANDPAAIRAINVPDATDAQATTLRLIGEGLIALTAGEPRAALDYLLESLAGLPSIGGSRVQQEVVLETALAAMLQLGAPGQAARLLSRHRAAPGPRVTRGAIN
ncbi:FAD/NAD(P)-binding protein [Candidatus Mycobacterium methanotrophicum]|uniref:FAD/NAD(P)-binding protein n=1 Tax=Candidatus Mycobacterium methanotrophicum TaxID=2943498 RepID=A0ABY4QF53_9MYCO|nr:FAD/NAD(P)-binding protein [Candidatus Mycobacterium methanotrophicum]UQX09612.1 FAD/NAD(P)-binding protein [Candidatus Mycobacterium methanotrophicum]